ncbi:MAG: hypothetical protein A2945_04970 [Candidatus Liptonbacteria bacterium RIFCSPLOWO2_01_FULL_52_25]|uniref:Uncharacterized protein n=1 Tax=Candidatus Liptonbacteria bacterium RIFCSPLOWO2_01_FULL_52_25 TaxID=1798650 RepID=A0A1G2CDL4_9BACT|nr:MAG: hypothetical protein A2945_04970 [Candidatus Liptonbacteria bacterium RIFCSPLOWO2_01_FULL_52_25]
MNEAKAPQIPTDKEGGVVKNVGDLASSLRKLSNTLRRAESEKSLAIMEAQMVNHMVEIARHMELVNEGKRKENVDVLVASLLTLVKIMEGVGEVSKGINTKKLEGYRREILKSLKNVEDRCLDFLSSIAPFKDLSGAIAGPLQKLISTIQEKRHFLAKKLVDIPEVGVDPFA